MQISMTQIEAAINYWSRQTQGDGVKLSSEVSVLADVYGQMIFDGHSTIERADMTEEAFKALQESGVFS
jgi:hypothetical protein